MTAIPAPPPALAAQGITLRHSGVTQALVADVSFAADRGEIVAIIGPSGVGKSSLLRVLAGLDAPAAGRVTVAGTPLSGPHPRVAMAFQSPALLPWRTLERNVSFGLDFRNQPRLSGAERTDRIDRAIAEVGLDHARRRRPAQLSGGMAQRAALARCLARQPDVLLLDEPFGALDAVTRADMQALLLRIVADYRTATVLVTHDIDEALRVADRILLLAGSPAAIAGQWDRGDAPSDTHRTDIIRALETAMKKDTADAA